jgi:hypothetical protein
VSVLPKAIRRHDMSLTDGHFAWRELGGKKSGMLRHTIGG